ncbi:MAG: hypothetical protein M1829_001837 [Trizodia sp. TS-e1964]|nr:MAG: hypothetical protein M1829_001837 [Trizodia sp. TS-e1964]
MICETTPGVKSYSGYIHFPPGTVDGLGPIQNYTMHTFFWFFESRKDPANAPLSVYIHGGPGTSSMLALFQEHGPCRVNMDSNSTYLNPFSWNNEVNMLYIDQPLQSGFSYDVPTNGSFDIFINTITPGVSPADLVGANFTRLPGTFPSLFNNATSNTTYNAAQALWHITQTWLTDFPQYKPKNNKLSIWAQSYGGRIAAVALKLFKSQNDKIASGAITGQLLTLETLGIVNGCLDIMVQLPKNPHFAFNNTYGIQVINQTTYDASLNVWGSSGGCKDKILNCRSLAAQFDPNFLGNDSRVNDACSDAGLFCAANIDDIYSYKANNSYYDVAHSPLDPFPPVFFLGYLAESWVQGALGVPVNFTKSSSLVGGNFQSTGDSARSTFLDDAAYLLDNGVKIALMYGDRDYGCNWIGGEAVSLAINHKLSSNFRQAGYTNIQTNGSYVGGQVRQHGNFSFSRVYQAGKMVAAYQPETAYQIFQRTMFNTDVATGKVSSLKDFATTGPSTTWQLNDRPTYPEPTCYILDPKTCTDGQYTDVMSHLAIVQNYIVIGNTRNGTGIPFNDATTAASGGRAKGVSNSGMRILIEANYISLLLSTFTLALTIGLGILL